MSKSAEEKVIKGITKTGFTYTISKNNFDDYELFELLSEVDEDTTVFPKVANKLLGKNQVTKLKDHLRREDGTISVQKFMKEIEDILTSAQPAKN